MSSPARDPRSLPPTPPGARTTTDDPRNLDAPNLAPKREFSRAEFVVDTLVAADTTLASRRSCAEAYRAAPGDFTAFEDRIITAAVTEPDATVVVTLVRGLLENRSGLDARTEVVAAYFLGHPDMRVRLAVAESLSSTVFPLRNLATTLFVNAYLDPHLPLGRACRAAFMKHSALAFADARAQAERIEFLGATTFSGSLELGLGLLLDYRSSRSGSLERLARHDSSISPEVQLQLLPVYLYLLARPGLRDNHFVALNSALRRPLVDNGSAAPLIVGIADKLDPDRGIPLLHSAALGPNAQAGPTDRLERYLGSDDHDVQRMAVNACSDVLPRVPRATRERMLLAFRGIIDRQSHPTSLRVAAIRALGEVRDGCGVLADLERLRSRDPNPEVRRAVSSALGSILQHSARSKDWAAPLPEGEYRFAEAMTALVECARDRDEGVRGGAIRQINISFERGDALALYSTGLRSKNLAVIREAAESLGEVFEVFSPDELTEKAVYRALGAAILRAYLTAPQQELVPLLKLLNATGISAQNHLEWKGLWWPIRWGLRMIRGL